jgi:hypothetical protein
MTDDLLETINRELQHLPISPERWKELAVELRQLHDAVEAAAAVHNFDRDPGDFQLLLRSAKP